MARKNVFGNFSVYIKKNTEDAINRALTLIGTFTLNNLNRFKLFKISMNK